VRKRERERETKVRERERRKGRGCNKMTMTKGAKKNERKRKKTDLHYDDHQFDAFTLHKCNLCTDRDRHRQTPPDRHAHTYTNVGVYYDMSDVLFTRSARHDTAYDMYPPLCAVYKERET